MKTPPPPPPILTKIPVSSDHLCRPKAPQPASDSFVRGLCYIPHAGPDSFGRGFRFFRTWLPLLSDVAFGYRGKTQQALAVCFFTNGPKIIAQKCLDCAIYFVILHAILKKIRESYIIIQR